MDEDSINFLDGGRAQFQGLCGGTAALRGRPGPEGEAGGAWRRLVAAAAPRGSCPLRCLGSASAVWDCPSGTGCPSGIGVAVPAPGAARWLQDALLAQPWQPTVLGAGAKGMILPPARSGPVHGDAGR